MDREALTHSLSTLTEEIEALRRDEFAAGLSGLAAGSRLEGAAESGDLNPEFADLQHEKMAKSQARKEMLASVRKRMERIGQALETDAAALSAERDAYAHAIAAMAVIERPPATPDIHDDAPLRLEDAVCLPELGGSPGSPSTTVSVKMLRLAIERGQLAVVRPNTKNLYVTRKLIREWQESCLGQKIPFRSSSSAKSGRTRPEGSRTRPNTSSTKTETSTSLDSARMILNQLKQPSAPSSPKGMRKK
jgi:hypothetical protein